MFYLTNDILTKYYSRKHPVNPKLPDILTKQRRNARHALKYIVVSDESKIVRRRIGDLKPETVSKILHDCSLTPALALVFEALFFELPMTIVEKNYNDNYVRAFLTNLYKKGKRYTGSLIHVDSAYDILNLSEDSDLHAAVIAYFGLNKIRDLCPNFRYFYAFINSEVPVTRNDDVGKVVSWLPRTQQSSRGQVTMGFWESMDKGTLFSDALPGMAPLDFMNYYFQILYALRTANIACQFSHFMLIPNHVYLNKTSPTSILYSTEAGDEFLNTDTFVKMCYFNQSHALLKISTGRYHFGNDKFPENSWLIQDAYSFLMTSMAIAFQAGNEQLLKVGAKIFTYFNREDSFEESLSIQSQFDYQLPYTKETRSWSLDQLCEYIRASIKIPFLTIEPEHKRYSTMDSSLLETLKMTETRVPKQILDFFDLFVHMENPSALVDRYNYAMNVPDFVSEIRDLRRRVNDRLDLLEDVPIDQREFIEKVYDFLAAVDLFIYANFYTRVIVKVAQVYNDPIVKETMISEGNTLRERWASILQKWTKAINERTDSSLSDYWSLLVEW